VCVTVLLCVCGVLYAVLLCCCTAVCCMLYAVCCMMYALYSILTPHPLLTTILLGLSLSEEDSSKLQWLLTETFETELVADKSFLIQSPPLLRMGKEGEHTFLVEVRYCMLYALYSILYTNTPLPPYYYTTILLYYYTTVLLYTILLYSYTTILLYYYTTTLLYYYTTILLYYCTTTLLYYYTTILL
jgi:hypothetical protein